MVRQRRLLKVEILLPKYYNDGTKIDGKKFRITYQEIFEQFGGYSKPGSTLVGYWLDPETNKQYRDENITFWVVCGNNRKNKAFLANLKETLKERFKQKEIMIYYSDVYLC